MTIVSFCVDLELFVQQVLDAELHAQAIRREERVDEVERVERLLVGIGRAVAAGEEQPLAERVVRDRERVRAVVGVEPELQIGDVLGVLRHRPHVVRDVEADVADRELGVAERDVAREEERLEESRPERRRGP